MGNEFIICEDKVLLHSRKISKEEFMTWCDAVSSSHKPAW